MKFIIAQKNIPPSVQRRKAKPKIVCKICEVKLQCLCESEHNCAWICANHGGPEFCKELFCNTCWHEHYEEFHSLHVSGYCYILKFLFSSPVSLFLDMVCMNEIYLGSEMGWTGYIINISVWVDSHGGERQVRGEQLYEEFKQKLTNLCEEYRKKFIAMQ
jgi:hypothetical protein